MATTPFRLPCVWVQGGNRITQSIFPFVTGPVTPHEALHYLFRGHRLYQQNGREVTFAYWGPAIIADPQFVLVQRPGPRVPPAPPAVPYRGPFRRDRSQNGGGRGGNWRRAGGCGGYGGPVGCGAGYGGHQRAGGRNSPYQLGHGHRAQYQLLQQPPVWETAPSVNPYAPYAQFYQQPGRRAFVANPDGTATVVRATPTRPSAISQAPYPAAPWNHTHGKHADTAGAQPPETSMTGPHYGYTIPSPSLVGSNSDKPFTMYAATNGTVYEQSCVMAYESTGGQGDACTARLLASHPSPF